MKTILQVPLVIALLAAPLFAANPKDEIYLALGDSIPFGMNILLVPPFSPTLPSPNQFVGFPETIATFEGLVQTKQEVNAACPGETSASFLNSFAPDFGCNSPRMVAPGVVVPGFKTIGLKANYTGAQMAYAEAQLANNKKISLVTLSIGANDFLLRLTDIQACGTDTNCQNAILGPLFQTYSQNLTQILIRIRAQYKGTLVMTTYYSPDPTLDTLTAGLNQVIMQTAQQAAAQNNFAPVKFADAYSAFKIASAFFHGDACKAGLLIRLPALPGVPPCDIHPSPAGRDLLAAIVEVAIGFHH